MQAHPLLAGVRDGGFPFTLQSEEKALRYQQLELLGKGRQRIVLSERARTALGLLGLAGLQLQQVIHVLQDFSLQGQRDTP